MQIIGDLTIQSTCNENDLNFSIQVESFGCKQCKFYEQNLLDRVSLT